MILRSSRSRRWPVFSLVPLSLCHCKGSGRRAARRYINRASTLVASPALGAAPAAALPDTPEQHRLARLEGAADRKVGAIRDAIDQLNEVEHEARPTGEIEPSPRDDR